MPTYYKKKNKTIAKGDIADVQMITVINLKFECPECTMGNSCNIGEEKAKEIFENKGVYKTTCEYCETLFRVQLSTIGLGVILNP